MDNEGQDLTAAILASLETSETSSADETGEDFVPEESEDLGVQPTEEVPDLTEEEVEEVRDFLEELSERYPEYFQALQKEQVDPRAYLENLIKLDIEFRKNPQETLKRMASAMQINLETLEPEEQEAVNQVIRALQEMSKSYYEALNYIHAQQRAIEDQLQRQVFASLDAFLREEDPRGINRMELFKNDTFRNQLSVTTQALMNQNPYMDFSTATRRAFDILVSSLLPEKTQTAPKPQVTQETPTNIDPSKMGLEDIVATYYRMLK